MPVPTDFDFFYLSYSGISLPLKLVSPIDAASTQNRNTFFAEKQNADGLSIEIAKFTYGEMDLLHKYIYDESGMIVKAEITDGEGEIQHLSFDSQGRPYPV